MCLTPSKSCLPVLCFSLTPSKCCLPCITLASTIFVRVPFGIPPDGEDLVLVWFEEACMEVVLEENLSSRGAWVYLVSMEVMFGG